MCGGGGAKSPRTKTDKMSSAEIQAANRQIKEYSKKVKEANDLVEGQIQDQLNEATVDSRKATNLLAQEQQRQRKLTAQQIKGSYRTTLGGGSFAGAKVMRTRERGARPKAPLQIATGSVLGSPYQPR